MVIFVGKKSLKRPENIDEQEKYALIKVKELKRIIEKHEKFANDNELLNIKGTYYHKKVHEFSIEFSVHFDTYYITEKKTSIEEIHLFLADDSDIKKPKINEDVVKYLKNLKEELQPLLNEIGTIIYWEYSDSDVSFSFKVQPFYDYYSCPICERSVEKRDWNKYAYRFIGCNNPDHELVIFDEDFINKKYNNGKRIDKRDEITVLEQSGDEEGYNVYEYFHLFVLLEKHSFRTLDKERYISGIEKLYIVTYNNLPAGYMTWNYDHGPVLRQIFILEDYRRLGIGSYFTKTAINNEVGQKEFGIESPNNEFILLLAKNELAKIENGKIIPIGWYWVQGM